ncbi:MAG: hypothetical protein NDF52_06295 [archaeon YNP-WB-062]|nr:hypothetical protein [Candidatus Culexarchaeum yellowstonense]
MKFLRHGNRNIGIAGLSLGEVRKAGRVIADKMFSERYVLFYGFPSKRIIMKTKVFYVDPPLIRGKAMKVAIKLIHQPIVVIINAESNCINKDLVEKSIDEIESGEYAIHMSIPYTSTKLEMLYRKATSILLNIFPNVNLPNYPSYSLIVGVRKYFDLDEDTLWNYEHLVTFMALLDGKTKVRIDDSNCKDNVQPVFSGMEELFIKSMLKSIIRLAIRRNIIERNIGLELLKEIEVNMQ